MSLPIVDEVHPLRDDLFGPPQDARTGRVTVVRPGAERRWTHHDLDERRTDVVASRDDGVYILDDIGTEQSFTRVRSHSIVDGDPTSARASVTSRATYRRDEWDVRVEADIAMTCTADTFVVTGAPGRIRPRRVGCRATLPPRDPPPPCLTPTPPVTLPRRRSR